MSGQIVERRGVVKMLSRIIEKLSIALDNQNTTKDTLFMVLSLTPILPWFVFVPKFLKNLSFNMRWFNLFDSDNHRANIRSIYGVEIL